MKRGAAVALAAIAVAAAALLARACSGDASAPVARDTVRSPGRTARDVARPQRTRTTTIATQTPPTTPDATSAGPTRTARVIVTVLASENHKPIAGARVLIHDAVGDCEFTAGDDGRAVVGAAPGEVDLGVVASGRARQQSHVSVEGPDAPKELTFSLEPGAAAVGRITDSRTGAPIAGAAVAVRIGGFNGFSLYVDAGKWEVGSTKTAADGSFSIDGLAPGQVFSLHASADGYADGERPATPYVPGRCAVDLALNPGRAIVGRVLDENAVAVAGVEVVCRPAWTPPVQTGPFGDGSRTLRTDKEGRFSFSGLDEDGVHLVRARRDDAVETTEKRIAPKSRDEVVLRFERPATLRVLQRKDRPKDGAAEVFRISTLLTSDYVDSIATDGVQEIKLSSGTYRVRLIDDTLDPPPSVDVVLAPGEERTCEVATLDGRFDGRVVDVNGRPIAGAEVMFVGSEQRDATVESDDHGEFSMTGLPLGPGAIAISHGGELTLRTDIVLPVPHRDWVLMPGDVARIVLPPEARGRRIRVEVDVRSVASLGWGMDGWEMRKSTLETSVDDAADPLTLFVGDASALRFRIRVDGFVPKVVETEPARGQALDVDVGPLLPGPRIMGRVVDPEGAPIPRPAVDVENPLVPSSLVQTQADGRFRTEVVEPGTVRLNVSVQAGFLPRTVSIVVRGPDDEPVTITLYRGGFVDVVAVDAHDAPVVNRDLDARDETGAHSAWGLRTDNRGRALVRLNPGAHHIAMEGADTATVTVVEGGRQTLRLVVR